MASTGDGFKVTMGIMMAIVFVVIIIPTVLLMLMCGGCAIIGIGAPALKQAQDAAKRVEEKRRMEQSQPATPPVDVMPEATPENPVDAEQPIPANPEQPAIEKPIGVTPEVDTKPTPERTATPTEAPDDAPKIDTKAEAAAVRKLKLAKTFISRDKATAAKRLKEVVDQYPATDAATEARELLKTVEPE